MSIVKSPYSSGKVVLLRQLLENSAEAGMPSDYEIRVDGMKVIPRTKNPELFDGHEDFVNADTGEITIIIYEGSSRRSTRHVMSLKEEPKKETPPPPPPAPGLSGVEIEKMMEDKLKAQRQAFEHDLLKKENKELKEALDEADEESEKMVSVIEKAKANGNKIGGLHWGEIAGVAFEGIVKRNAHLLMKIPGAEGLAGLLTADDDAKLEEGKKQPVTEASFKEKGEPEEEPEEKEETTSFKKVNQAERDREGFIRELQTHFVAEEKVKLVFGLLNALISKPGAIEPAIIFVHSWENEKKPDSKQETAKRSPEMKSDKPEATKAASLPDQNHETPEDESEEETEQEEPGEEIPLPEEHREF